MNVKFQLEPYHRNISDKTFIDDLKQVAKKLGKKSVTMSEYNRYGTYHSSSLHNRFGSWFSALSKAGLDKSRSSPLNIHADECLDDLRRVAKQLGKDSVTMKEYNHYGKYSHNPFFRHFGSWLQALQRAGLKPTRDYNVTNEEYFKNLEFLWRSLGRQPRYSEVVKPFSKYVARAYQRRFGSWRKALEAFVEFVNQRDAEKDLPSEPATNVVNNQTQKDALLGDRKDSELSRSRKTSRSVSWRLRFLVMRRDSFKCCLCGASPALTHGLVLHIDHIEPWSKGGETVMENLQTLCERCNIGKSDLLMQKEVQQARLECGERVEDS